MYGKQGSRHLAQLVVAVEALAIDLVHGAQLPQCIQRDDPGGHHDELCSTQTRTNLIRQPTTGMFEQQPPAQKLSGEAMSSKEGKTYHATTPF